MDEGDIAETMKNPEEFRARLIRQLKAEAAKHKAAILLDHVDVDKENARLKALKDAPPSTPKRRSTFVIQPSRRSTRVSLTPGRYSDMAGDDDDDDKLGKKPRRAAKRKATSSGDDEWRGKQRTSQLSRGELKPYVPRVNSYGPIDGEMPELSSHA
jgi:hypothetical protein